MKSANIFRTGKWVYGLKSSSSDVRAEHEDNPMETSRIEETCVRRAVTKSAEREKGRSVHYNTTRVHLKQSEEVLHPEHKLCVSAIQHEDLRSSTFAYASGPSVAIRTTTMSTTYMKKNGKWVYGQEFLGSDKRAEQGDNPMETSRTEVASVRSAAKKSAERVMGRPVHYNTTQVLPKKNNDVESLSFAGTTIVNRHFKADKQKRPNFINRLKSKAKAEQFKKAVKKKGLSTVFLHVNSDAHMFGFPSLPTLPTVKMSIDDETKTFIQTCLGEFTNSLKHVEVNHKCDMFNSVKNTAYSMWDNAINFAKDPKTKMLGVIVFLYFSGKTILERLGQTGLDAVTTTVTGIVEFATMFLDKSGLGEGISKIVDFLKQYSEAIIKTVCSWLIPAPMFEEHSFTDSALFLGVVGLCTFVYNGCDMSINGAIKVVKNILALDGKRNIESSFLGFLDIVRSVCSYIGNMTGIEFLQKVGLPPPEFTQELAELEAKYYSLLGKDPNDRVTPPWNKRDVENMTLLCTQLTEKIFQAKGDKNKVAHYQRVRDAVTKILNVAKAAVRSVGELRAEGVGVVMFGLPGAGKSLVNNFLSAAINARVLEGRVLQECMENPASQTFNEVPNSEYHDHYSGQFCHMKDDAFSAKEVPGATNADSLNIIRFINSQPLLLNAAELSNKSNLVYNSKVLLVTTNVSKLTSNHTNAVNNYDAVIRRFKFVYHVVKSRDDLPILPIYIQSREGDSKLAILDDYFIFKRHDWSTGNPVPNVPDINFSKLVDLIVEEVELKEELHKNTLMPTIYSVMQDFVNLEAHMDSDFANDYSDPKTLGLFGGFEAVNLIAKEKSPTLIENMLSHILPTVKTFMENRVLRVPQPDMVNITLAALEDIKRLKYTTIFSQKFGGDARTKVLYDAVHDKYIKRIVLRDLTASEAKLVMDVRNITTYLENGPEVFVKYLLLLLYLCCSCNKLSHIVEEFLSPQRLTLEGDGIEEEAHKICVFLTKMSVRFTDNLTGYKLGVDILSGFSHIRDHKYSLTMSNRICKAWLSDDIWAEFFQCNPIQVPLKTFVGLEDDIYVSAVTSEIHVNPGNFMRFLSTRAIEKYKDNHCAFRIVKSYFSVKNMANIAITIAGIVALGRMMSDKKGKVIDIDNLHTEQSGRLSSVNKHTVRAVPRPLPKQAQTPNLVEHSMNVSALEGLENKTFGNLYSFSTSKTGNTQGHILLLKNSLGVGLVHYLSLFETLKDTKNTVYFRKSIDDPMDPKAYFSVDIDALIDSCYTPDDEMHCDLAYYKIVVPKTFNGEPQRNVVGKDLTSYLLTRKEFAKATRVHGASKQLQTVLLKGNKLESFGKVNLKCKSWQLLSVMGAVSYGSDDQFRVNNALGGTYPCKKGDCGFPLIGCTNLPKQAVIFSIHCSGNTQTNSGISAPFFLEDFEQYCSVFDVPKVMDEHSGEQPCPEGWVPTPLDYSVKFYGALGYDTRFPFTGQSSNLRKNETWFRCSEGERSGLEPAVLGKTPGNNPLYNAMSNYGKSNASVPSEIVDMVGEVVTRKIIDTRFNHRLCRLLTEREALAGVWNPGHTELDIQGINPATSPGYPMSNICHNKSAWILDGVPVEGPDLDLLCKTVQELKMKAIRDESMPCVIVDSLKDEVRALNSEGVVKNARMISVTSLDCQVLAKMYYACMSTFLHDNRIYNGISVGVNPYKEFADMYRLFAKFFIVDGDFSKFDGNLPLEFYMWYAHAANIWYSKRDPDWKPEDDVVRLWIVKNASSSLHMYGYGNDKQGAVVHNSQCSGHFLTSDGNSFMGIMINFCNVLKLWLEGPDKVEVHMGETLRELFFRRRSGIPMEIFSYPIQQYGDDHFLAVPKDIAWVRQDTYSKSMCELGFKHTASDKSEHATSALKTIDDISYLKRRFVELKGRIVGCLEYNSILKMIEYSCPGKQTSVEESQVVDTMLVELAPHGLEVFISLSKKLQNYCDAKGFFPKFLPLGRNEKSYVMAYNAAVSAFLDTEDYYAMM